MHNLSSYKRVIDTVEPFHQRAAAFFSGHGDGHGHHYLRIDYRTNGTLLRDDQLVILAQYRLATPYLACGLPFTLLLHCPWQEWASLEC